MKLRTLITALLLLAAGHAVADFKTVIEAHEVPLDQFIAPVSSSGMLSFRTCTDCDLVSARLTPNTKYYVDRKAVELREFRRAFFSLRNRNAASLTVLEHLETDTITAVKLYL